MKSHSYTGQIHTNKYIIWAPGCCCSCSGAQSTASSLSLVSGSRQAELPQAPSPFLSRVLIYTVRIQGIWKHVCLCGLSERVMTLRLLANFSSLKLIEWKCILLVVNICWICLSAHPRSKCEQVCKMFRQIPKSGRMDAVKCSLQRLFYFPLFCFLTSS